jgi:hypothetical protein
LEKRVISQIAVAAEPLHLRPGVPVDDITLVVLETPGDHDEDVPFPDPNLLLYFAFDPPETGDTVKTPDTDVVSSHHQFGTGKDLLVSLVRKPDPDDLLRLSWSRFLLGQSINLLLLLLRYPAASEVPL